MTLDKQVVMQIIGALMKQPALLSEVDNYCIIPSDFENSFEQYVFMSIANLARDGAEKISIVDIDGYMAEKPHIYEIFSKYNGIEYLQDAIELSDPENFKYYYNQLKKYNVLKDLKNCGYNTDLIYPDKDMMTTEDYAKRERFDKLSISDIFTEVKTEITRIESKYGTAAAATAKADQGILDLIKKLQTEPEVGAPMQGNILNTVTRGARKGKFYIMSAMSGGSKTRTMVGNACYMAYPIRYDGMQHRWVNMGSCEKVLYVGTEQVIDEIQTMILAYLTDLNEDIILNGIYNDEEAERIKVAAKIMEMYSDNFIITQLPEPNLSQVKTHFRHHCLSNGVEYVFYDYIFATPSLLNEFRDLAIRADVALRMLSTLLKDLAVELNCFVMSATQITGSMEYKPGYIRNYMLLRDSKSIPDKADFAAIKAKVLPEELNMLEKICKQYGAYPNQVTDVYKMRRGRYVDIRIWSLADLGTCRSRDLFMTDADMKEITDFKIKELLIDYDGSEKALELVNMFNTGEVGPVIEQEIVSQEVEQLIEQSEPTVEEIFTGKPKEPITVDNWDSLF